MSEEEFIRTVDAHGVEVSQLYFIMRRREQLEEIAQEIQDQINNELDEQKMEPTGGANTKPTETGPKRVKTVDLNATTAEKQGSGVAGAGASEAKQTVKKPTAAKATMAKKATGETTARKTKPAKASMTKTSTVIDKKTSNFAAAASANQTGMNRVDMEVEEHEGEDDGGEEDDDREEEDGGDDDDDTEDGMPMNTPQTCFNDSARSTFVRRRMHKCLMRHQEAALNAIVKHFEKRKPNGALVVLPTGAGKTAIAVLAPYLLRSSKVLVVTPSLVITNQLAEAFFDTTRCTLVKLNICENVGTRPKKFQIRWKQQWLPTSDPRAPQASGLGEALAAPLMIMNAQRVQYHTNAHPEVLKDASYDLVIVDEAHHCPAETWKNILKQFDKSKTSFLFLTATPMHNNKRILTPEDGVTEVYTLSREEAVRKGVIRDLMFDDGTGDNTFASCELLDEDPIKNAYMNIARLMKLHLAEADSKNRRSRFHQAMALVADKEKALLFASIYNAQIPEGDRERAHCYFGETRESVVEHFRDHKFRTLVVVGCLLEGFDHANVVVAAIARNCRSPVVFSQFVGRAIRMDRTTGLARLQENEDKTTVAIAVSHPSFEQRRMFDNLDSMMPENEADQEQ